MTEVLLAPILASWFDPFEMPAAIEPDVVTSRNELEVAAPVGTRRPLAVVACPELPGFSLVLDASDLESSGAARGFDGAISCRVLTGDGRHSKLDV